MLSTIKGTGYEVLAISILAAVLAQIMKFIGYFFKSKKFDFRVLFTTGGMPSSHSAGVMGLATTVGFICGFDSIEFAIALGNALVVMYDAAGLRRAAGKMAKTINLMREDFYQHRPQMTGERLKELLGHTPMEVTMGALWAICFAYFIHFYVL